MNENLPLIWMNVTTSFNWTRPPVGIIRVERSLCTELKKLYGNRFKQCIWQDDRFIELSSLEDKGMLTDSSSIDNKNSEPYKNEHQFIYQLLPKRQAIKVAAQAFLSLMPSKLRPFINNLLILLKPKIGDLLRLMNVKSSAAKKTFTSKKSSHDISQVPFSSGDILLSIGLDWDYSYHKSFYSLRKTYGVKVVSCCYDLIPVLYPQYCVGNVAGIFTSYFLEIADGSDLIMCISKQSENDLNELLERTGGARPLTKFLPLGDNVPETTVINVSAEVKSICKNPFILFVSTIERRKNHEVLYRAYHLLCKQHKNYNLPKLVFVGMQGWGVGDLLKDIELDPLTSNSILRLNHVNDSELRLLYESALFCVFPSLYEGWGLPVGEALAMGKAVLSSNRGSLPEVGTNLVRYIDPWCPQAWADEIYRMSSDEIWRKEWELKVRTSYITKTWSGSALSIKENLDLLN